MESKKHILLVEDDASLGYLLSEYLKMKDFNITWEQSPVKALKLMDQQLFDLAILDIMMPEMDGFALATEINKSHQDLPFLFLTARSLKVDVLKGFSLGAVDYLKKPIDEEELVVRIKALLSRIGGSPAVSSKPDVISLGAYQLHTNTQKLLLGDAEIHLTTRENELLQYLALRPGQLCSHKDILVEIWGRNDYFNKKSLNVFITHLRRYLEKDASLRIENVHGQGFIFRMDQPK